MVLQIALLLMLELMMLMILQRLLLMLLVILHLLLFAMRLGSSHVHRIIQPLSNGNAFLLLQVQAHTRRPA